MTAGVLSPDSIRLMTASDVASGSASLPATPSAQDWLGSYREFAVLEQVIAGMQRRLSRPQLLDGSLAELERLYQPLSEDFRAFYPELIAFARQA